jgi:aminoglycoside phosphotransferase (APT) family kinase protein
MALTVDEARGDLQRFLVEAAGADECAIETIDRLPSGSLQEHWRLDVAFTGGSHGGRRSLVLRANRAGAAAQYLTRGQELVVMKAAFAAGVIMPEPLWADPGTVFGRDFMVMGFAPGTAVGPRVVRDGGPGGDHDRLADCLGAELAKIQTITPGDATLAFLDHPGPDTAGRRIAEMRGYLDSHDDPHPVLEWGLRWAELNAPPASPPVLRHGDFRTGNYLVDDGGLTGIIDWELAAWGDPMEDLAWFCIKFWRWGRSDREAGGLASRDRFLDGYARVAGHRPDAAAVHYWDVMANLRWAVVSMQQAERHLSGRDPSLELALTGRMTAEMELEVLRLIDGAP